MDLRRLSLDGSAAVCWPPTGVGLDRAGPPKPHHSLAPDGQSVAHGGGWGGQRPLTPKGLWMESFLPCSRAAVWLCLAAPIVSSDS